MDKECGKYPVGVQSFREIRTGNYYYADKTEYVWQLVNTGKYYFLSRPRRFGKSLLLSTLEAYLSGCKGLFEGLKIASLEKEWTQYPVLHLDLNIGKYDNLNSLTEVIDSFIEKNARRFKVAHNPDAEPELRFQRLIEEIEATTMQQVVVLVDEYNKPLLNSIDKESVYREMQRQLKAFYGVLKTCDKSIKFAMLTGVARFGKVSIFSDLNNLRDISLDSTYNGACGISESELEEVFEYPIKKLAECQGMTVESTKSELRRMYDGYRFSGSVPHERIYNPFSIINCFASMNFGEYWFDTGTPSFLMKMLVKAGFNFSREQIDVTENILKGVNVPEGSPFSLLYQTGYFTIKDYDKRFRRYTLGLPNEEVRTGFNSMAFIAYGGRRANEFSIPEFLDDLESGNVGGFMQRLKSMISSIPYEQAIQSESVYHNVLYLLFTMLNYQTETETHLNNGRTDMVVKTRDYIYIFEFKFNQPVAKAMSQINSRHYDEPYKADGRKIIKIGVNFSPDERNIQDWNAE